MCYVLMEPHSLLCGSSSFVGPVSVFASMCLINTFFIRGTDDCTLIGGQRAVLITSLCASEVKVTREKKEKEEKS